MPIGIHTNMLSLIVAIFAIPDWFERLEDIIVPRVYKKTGHFRLNQNNSGANDTISNIANNNLKSANFTEILRTLPLIWFIVEICRPYIDREIVVWNMVVIYCVSQFKGWGRKTSLGWIQLSLIFSKAFQNLKSSAKLLWNFC